MKKNFSFLEELLSPFISSRAFFKKIVPLVIIFSLIITASVIGIFGLKNVIAQGPGNSENQRDRDGRIGNPNVECEAQGFDFGIAKWEWKDNSWQIESQSPFPLDGYNTNVSGNAQTADWTSDPAVAGVVAKTATSSYVFDGGTSGVSQIDDTDTRTHNISHITFCGNENESETELETATVIAHKVVCDSEELLPNMSGGNITENTARQFADDTDGCELVEDWDFEYKITDDQSNPGNDTVGPKGGDWVTFTNTIEIPTDNVSLIQMREVLPTGYIPFSGDGDVSAEFYCQGDVVDYDNWEWIQNPQDKDKYYCVGFNAEELIDEEPRDDRDRDHLTIIGTKIMCDDEVYLPNWGDGSFGPITATTATNWLAEKDNRKYCQIVPWDFEWAPAGTANLGDNQGLVGGDWTQFNGSTTISSLEDIGDRIWVREDWNDTLVPFTGLNTEQDESAEIYCHTDTLHYDNYDFIVNPELGETYYCVAWNAPIEANQCIDELNGSLADRVKSTTQGLRRDGSAVLDSRSDPTLTLIERSSGDSDDFFSLGFGGSIVLSFDSFVPDVDGADLAIHEVTNGTYPLETADIHVSQDGSTWSLAGVADNTRDSRITEIDFSSTTLRWIKFVRITDTSDPSIFSDDADGFDLDTVRVTRQVCRQPEDPRTRSCDPNLNILTNAGFEEPRIDNDRGRDLFDSVTRRLGWIVKRTPALIRDSETARLELRSRANERLPSTGDQYARLGTDQDRSSGRSDDEEASVSIHQNIPTVSGRIYSLSYDFSPRPNTPATENVLEVLIDDSLLDTHTAAGLSQTSWTSRSLSFTGTGNPIKIEFRNRGTRDSLGTLIDNTRLVCEEDRERDRDERERERDERDDSSGNGDDNADVDSSNESSGGGSGGGGNIIGGSGGGSGSSLPLIAGSFTEIPEGTVLGATTFGLPNTGRAEDNSKGLLFALTLILSLAVLLGLNYQVFRKTNTKKII